MVPRRLPSMSYRKVAKLLQDEEFKLIGQQGSHVYFQHTDGDVPPSPVTGHGRSVGDSS